MKREIVLCMTFLIALSIIGLGQDNWLNQGAALRAEGKYDEALQAFDKATAMEPPFDAHAWFDKGTVYWQLGKYEEAQQAFDRSIELNPQNSLPWYYKGIIYSDQKMYNEALQSFDKAIELNPQLDIAWYNKGYIFKEQGRDSEAIAALGKFAELLCDRFSTEHKLEPNGMSVSVEPNSPENVELEVTPAMSDSELAMFTSRPVIPKPPSPTDQPLQGENL